MSSDLAKRTEVIDMPTNCQTKICCLRKWVRKPESSITMTTLGPGYTTEVPFTRRCTHWHTGDLWAFGQLPPQGNRKWAKQSPLSLSTNGTGKGDSFPRWVTWSKLFQCQWSLESLTNADAVWCVELSKTAQKVPSPVNPYEYVICAEVRQFGVSAKTADSLYAFYVNNIYGTYGTECNISQ